MDSDGYDSPDFLHRIIALHGKNAQGDEYKITGIPFAIWKQSMYIERLVSDSQSMTMENKEEFLLPIGMDERIIMLVLWVAQIVGRLKIVMIEDETQLLGKSQQKQDEKTELEEKTDGSNPASSVSKDKNKYMHALMPLVEILQNDRPACEWIDALAALHDGGSLLHHCFASARILLMEPVTTLFNIKRADIQQGTALFEKEKFLKRANDVPNEIWLETLLSKIPSVCKCKLIRKKKPGKEI